MPIREYQIMHGAVLAKICRSETPVTLRMIETSNDSRATYIVNDDVFLYMKHSKSPVPQPREAAERWQFTFNRQHLQELTRLADDKPVCIVLICGFSNLQPVEVCLLECEHFLELVDVTSSSTQTIHVKLKKGARKFRVTGSGTDQELRIARNKLDEWTP